MENPRASRCHAKQLANQSGRKAIPDRILPLRRFHLPGHKASGQQIINHGSHVHRPQLSRQASAAIFKKRGQPRVSSIERQLPLF